MGSAADPSSSSPTSSLDPQHSQRTFSSLEDHDHSDHGNNSDHHNRGHSDRRKHKRDRSISRASPINSTSTSGSSGANLKKKKKKSKKERHGHREFDADHTQDRPANSPDAPSSAQKLPPIKISLRLPAFSAITTSTLYKPGNDSGPSNKSNKKRRLSDNTLVPSDEDVQDERRPEQDQHRSSPTFSEASPSHKKKKKKHKHKHRHPHHEEDPETAHSHHHHHNHHHNHNHHNHHDNNRRQHQPHMSHDRSSQSPSSEHFHETLDLQSSPRNEQLAQPFQEQTPDVRLELEDASQRGLTEQSEGTPQPLDVDAREQSAKPSRKTKAVKRTLTPKPSVPAVPKKKELSVVCHKLLDSFIRKDSYLLFSQPVDPNLVPDYSTVIKNPMDFSTMRAKVERNFYPNIDEFLADFKLVCDNARLYNSKETLYWKQADKLWDWGSRAIERDRKSIMDKEDGMQKLIKDEENLDVVGMGDQGLTIHTVTAPSASRPSMLSIDGALDSPMSLAESGRPHTPQHYRKSKKIKHRRDGTIAFSYSTDGSIDPASHPDPWSLVPIGSSFGAKPSLSTPIEKSDPYYGLVLDDYPYWKSPCTTATQVATFLDYGAFSNSSSGDRAVGSQGIQNISAYTGMVFGDEQGESYVRSLAMFLEGVMEVSDDSQVDARSSEGLQLVQEYIRGKVEQLTRGASSIADKVAAVVRDESHGRESQVDSRIPLSLWNQDNYRTVNMKPAETSKSRMSEETTVKKEPVDNAVTEVLRGVERKPLHMSSQQGWDEVQMVDIRQVIHDIRSWPELQRKKSDYALWRKLLVELDSLILSTTSRAPSANTTSEDDKEAAALKVQWGEKWAGGDSVENRKWVWDYLQHNSDEIRRLSELLTAENKGNSSLDSTRKELIESVRKRLIEMVRFLPLSEINPSKLPPPVAPASASAPTSAVSPGSNAAPPTTAVTTPVATAVAGTTTVPAAEAASISASITATSTTPASTTPASAAFVSLAPVTSVPTATSPSVMPTAAEPTTTAQ